MNTLQFYLDETAKKYGHPDGFYKSVIIDVSRIINEAAELYAEEACKEQLQGIIKHVENANTAYWKQHKNNPDKKLRVVYKNYVGALTGLLMYLKDKLNAPLAVNTVDSGLAVRKEPLK